MVSETESLFTLRARVGGLRRRNADPDRIDEARRELAVAGLAEHIRRVVLSAPAPTQAQLGELRALLPSADSSR